MCTSRPSRNRPRPDWADRAGSLAGGGAVAALALLAATAGARLAWGPDPGEVRLHPETVLHVVLAPMPEVAVMPEVEPEPEFDSETEPEQEPDSETDSEPDSETEPEQEPDSEADSETDSETEPEPVPTVEEIVAMEAAQSMAETDGEAGERDAIRAEWLGELRRRIEQSKYYPGAARYSREAGTVRVRVEIGADGTIGEVQILDNTGSALLAEGARGILRRAAASPLGTNTLPEAFRVEVPITYRLGRR